MHKNPTPSTGKPVLSMTAQPERGARLVENLMLRALIVMCFAECGVVAAMFGWFYSGSGDALFLATAVAAVLTGGVAWALINDHDRLWVNTAVGTVGNAGLAVGFGILAAAFSFVDQGFEIDAVTTMTAALR